MERLEVRHTLEVKINMDKLDAHLALLGFKRGFRTASGLNERSGLPCDASYRNLQEKTTEHRATRPVPEGPQWRECDS